jgi:hypothetical protein
MPEEALDSREKAIEQLEIIGEKVKCQCCGELKPIITNSAFIITCHRNRIQTLKGMIKEIERHGTDPTKEKQELAELLEENRKREITKRIPLYSSKLTGYRFYCSKCYELEEQKQREREKGEFIPISPDMALSKA